MNEIIIVIPSLEPDIKLIKLIDSIRAENSSMEILVVDDGSGKEYANIFRRIEEESHSNVIYHSENFGKGVALKTAMKEIITNYPQARWMVTIDSDGQHSYQDMMKTVEMAKENPKALVMGTRQFDGEVPLRSRLGNVITRNFLAIMTGIKLDDTQTGLRVIPVSFLPKLIDVKGDRFEYETNMLIEAKKQSWPILSQTIATTYRV